MREISLKVGTVSQIIIERGITGKLTSRGVLKPVQSAFVVTDENVAPLYLGRIRDQLVELGCRVGSAVLPAGEQTKSLDSLAHLYERFVQEGLDRTSLVVALGGGVIGDLAGYAASTYMRGTRFVQMPTTLLAQVDASIGGKTAVNHQGLKNLVGTFYQPEAVIADPEVLFTLPSRELLSGFAEVVKAGMTGDADLFGILEKCVTLPSLDETELYEEIIFRAAAVKARVVEQDEREAGLRRILNFGHTIGHALEESAAFEGMLHGEAVAMGMVLETRLAGEMGLAGGLAERLEGLLVKLGFRMSLEGQQPENLMEFAHYDKKTRAGRLVFALPAELGRVEIHEDVDPLLVKKVLEEAVS
jgi:3-dehydroquinate synthase